jgi:aldose 1-epimerase
MKTTLAGLAAIALTSCASLSDSKSSMNVTSAPFGTTKGGQAVSLFTLTNAAGHQVKVTNYGGTVTNILVPDQAGQLGDVVLGFDSLGEYEEKSPYFGCITGRYANRIAKGKFTLDGKTYTLATNNGPNHLHGGKVGFDKKVWAAQPFQTGSSVGVHFSYTSPDGEEGYPGALTTKVTYSWNNDSELKIEYTATTDAPTVLNLTNHSYFNLAGGSRPILDHVLTLHSDGFTATDATAIPTGEIRPVAGGPFDFTSPERIGARIDAPDQQIKFGGGYDHNFVVRGTPGRLRPCAEVFEPTTGRTLTILTDQPAVQLYTGNFLNNLKGRGGVIYNKRHAFCLETQHYPDSPNQPAFPSTVLRPGETFNSVTVHQFGVRK